MNDEAANANAIIVSENRLGVFQVGGPSEVIQRATLVANELAKLVRDKHLSVTLQGRQYVKVEGWSTLGAMLGVLPREVSVERQEDGGYLAVVELVRVSDGAIIGRGSALCGMDERDRNNKLTWGSRPEYARRSMAITRATGKAYRLGFSWIMTLAGYEPTPAEEMDGVVVDAEVKDVGPASNPLRAAAEAAGNGKKPDPTTAFWAFVKKINYGKENGQAVVNECGGDFAKALEVLTAKETPPAEA